MKSERATAFRGKEALVEEFDNAVKLVDDQRFIEGRERDRLRETRGDLDKDQFAARRLMFQARQGQVGSQLQEIAAVVGPQLRLVHGQRPGDGFDFADERERVCGICRGREGGTRGGESGARRRRGQRPRPTVAIGISAGGQDLVEAAGEGDGPAAVEQAAFDRHLENGAGQLSGGADAHFVVPMLAKLGAPETLGLAAGFARAEDEIRKLPDAQAGGPVCEGKLHAEGTTEYTKTRKGRRNRREGR